ncbi:hypothetical protein BKA63DRAFT_137824 [Paraphoma chrysanthemicola]|nr:hypothetical protein BKA63DRAFT_137824 [Paraphoma chrysanthemicola]
MSRKSATLQSLAFRTDDVDTDIEDLLLSPSVFRPSHSPPAQRSVATVQTPVSVPGSSTTSSAGLASRARSTAPSSPAANFIRDNTLLDSTVAVLEECPICLDTYTSECCVRVTGVPGCTHRIGINCLERLLRNKSGDEKKCPMCRSVWIKGAVPSTSTEQERPSDPIEVSLAISQSSLAAEEHGRAPVESREGGRDLGLSARWTFAPRPQAQLSARRQTQPLPSFTTPVINIESDLENDNDENVANDSSYAAQLADYTTLASDIEAVRDRAKNTSGPCNQRRRETREASARQRASSRPGGMSPKPNIGPISGSPTPVRDARPIRVVGTNRSLSPLANPFRSIGNDRKSVPQRSATLGHSSTKSHGQTNLERRAAKTQVNDRPPRLNVDNPSASLLSNPAPTATRSPIPPRLLHPSHTPLRALDQLDSQLRQTQLHLTQRERDLDARQAHLLEREASLTAREKWVLERERRVEKALNRKREHWDELGMMVKRQTEEMERTVE